MVTRRKFIGALIGSGALVGSNAASAAASQRATGVIDRAALVRRHNPTLRKVDPLSPLSVGNGEFAFTCDVTGLQTFPREYETAMPLCTMSQWGWHTSPRPSAIADARLRLVEYDTHGRRVGYQTSSEGQAQLFNWLRENPHRLHLGQVGLYMTKRGGAEARVEEITDIEQTLDLWTGTITSRFRFDNQPVTVRTCVHPRRELLAVSVESPLIDERRLAADINFPYGSPKMHAADWEQPARHQTVAAFYDNARALVERTLDEDRYTVNVVALDTPLTMDFEGEHRLRLTPLVRRGARLAFVVDFKNRPLPGKFPTVRETFAASAAHWQRFWSTGGAIELAESRDPRAHELERRVVLSQYLTAIQCSGSQPPQETGLTVNSWYGKFHLEMHWWHAAHFPLWRRLPLLERSLGWYEKILPGARELARSQGYAGARWPKMVGPEGRDSPSPIGPLLIWQQPHPIFYAELCYLAGGGRRALERYRRVVFETAEFMSSFAFLDQRSGRYVLGPPVIPAQENHPPRETWNPTFEIAYWRYGLKTAQQWRERLGMRRDAAWDRVLARLAPLPVREGVYLAHENCPQTFAERNHDHPSMLGALGILDGDGADRETMRRTLKKVMKEWRWDETWGWDYPMTAMTAARLGETETAIDALLLKTAKNNYSANGHNYQRPNLPCYLPGNGGLLYAVALMAAGWRGAPRTHAPGFPARSWTVRWEGLNAPLLRQL